MYRAFIVRVFAGMGLLFAASGLLLSQGRSPRDVLKRFCELDERGEQLNPNGWQKVAALFVTPGAPQRDKITVVQDLVVSSPALSQGKAEFYVEYIELGRIDLSQARFSSLPLLKVRAGFFLVKPSAVNRGGAPNPFTETEWRIVGPIPEPHVNVDTAIRYATELVAAARDSAIRKNAEKTLANLKHFR